MNYKKQKTVPARHSIKPNANFPEGRNVMFRNKEWMIETSGETTLKLIRDDEVEIAYIGEEKIRLL